MSRATKRGGLAPNLMWAFYGRKGEHGTVSGVNMDSAQADECERELRALLRIARAAERYRTGHEAIPGHRCICPGTSCNGADLSRALARLSRTGRRG